MAYKVKVKFADLQDGHRLYHEGDTFPREGLSVSAERIASLSSNNNRMGYPLIEVIPEVETAEPVKDPTPAPRKRVKRNA